MGGHPSRSYPRTTVGLGGGNVLVRNRGSESIDASKSTGGLTGRPPLHPRHPQRALDGPEAHPEKQGHMEHGEAHVLVEDPHEAVIDGNGASASNGPMGFTSIQTYGTLT